MDEVEEEMAALLKVLGKLIEKLLNSESDVHFAWALMVINTETTKAAFIGNGDRDRMLEVLMKATKKATDAVGPPTQGSA